MAKEDHEDLKSKSILGALPTGPSESFSMSANEFDPDGKDQHELGSKLDGGKPQIVRFLIGYFPRALIEVARVSEVGAKKYTEKGWVTVKDGQSRYDEAAFRHVLKRAGLEEEFDDDTGLFHAAQEAWNALAKLELRLRELEKQKKWKMW